MYLFVHALRASIAYPLSLYRWSTHSVGDGYSEGGWLQCGGVIVGGGATVWGGWGLSDCYCHIASMVELLVVCLVDSVCI